MFYCVFIKLYLHIKHIVRLGFETQVHTTAERY